MTKDKPNPSRPKDPSAAADKRQGRLKSALKENLKRRKAQARSRAAEENSPPKGPQSD